MDTTLNREQAPRRARHLELLLAGAFVAITAISAGAQTPHGILLDSAFLSRVRASSRTQTLLLDASGDRLNKVLRSQTSLRLARGQVLVAPLGDDVVKHSEASGSSSVKPAVASAPAHIDLPVLLTMPDATGSVALVLRLQVVPDGGGLQLDPVHERYAGALLVTVEDTAAPTRATRLSRPVRILLTTVTGGSVTPTTITIGHTNLPERRVLLATESVRDTMVLQIKTDFLPDWTRYPIPFLRPTIQMDPSPPDVDGLGLGVAILNLGVVGRTLPGDHVISLTADRGSLDSTHFTLHNGIATARLRSRGLGRAVISAKSDLLGAAKIVVPFTWPIGFLLAALGGGVVGGLFWGTRKKEQSDQPALNQPRVNWAKVADGMLAGLASAVIYALGRGTALIPSGLPSEASVFVLALLASYPDLADRVKKVFVK